MPDFSRRTLLGIAPTIATLIASEAGLEAQGRGQQDVPQRVSKEQLNAALEVIGLEFTEAQREQPAFYVAEYLASAGLEVIPVPVYYPDVTAILGRPVFRKVADVPGEVDVVDVFRRPGDVPAHVDDIVAKHPAAASRPR